MSINPTEAQLMLKFGPPGTNQEKLILPYPMRLAWDLNKEIKGFSCHKLVKADLLAVFNAVLKEYGLAKIKELGLDIFGGCLNVRQMKGADRLSLHSWGIAVDLHPEKNQFKWDNKKALFAKPEYSKFWDIVERQGGVSLGRAKNYDWMHFQFTKGL